MDRRRSCLATEGGPDDAGLSFAQILDRIAGMPHVHFTGNPKDTLELDGQAYGASWRRMTWEALLALRDFADAAVGGRTHCDFRTWCEHAPYGAHTISPRKVVRGESKTVRANPCWRRQRTFPVPEYVHPSRRVFMGAHLRIGGGNTIAPRLHYFDGACTRHGVFIGYIGPHLTNTLT
ncbi:hypothetical protein I3F58_14730 [Streptomyces sp. MUM 203J]|uniref:hypothetical protein n=1 Tax=Streptomyces sp. MUM 203J TaxID=2791990 RepID=UPI001F03C1E6|nr:hypothetical protein [Streptomyces sp. MUM 203J]MCH0540801.1 hypothetical protein [Streptomyces sp. MUM 203J]